MSCVRCDCRNISPKRQFQRDIREGQNSILMSLRFIQCLIQKSQRTGSVVDQISFRFIHNCY